MMHASFECCVKIGLVPQMTLMHTVPDMTHPQHKKNKTSDN